eukprot:449416-Pelagomonas_calceolata.AAC.3
MEIYANSNRRSIPFNNSVISQSNAMMSPLKQVRLLTPDAPGVTCGPTVSIDLEPDTPMYEVKLQLQEATGIPVEAQKVMLAGIGDMVLGDKRKGRSEGRKVGRICNPNLVACIKERPPVLKGWAYHTDQEGKRRREGVREVTEAVSHLRSAGDWKLFLVTLGMNKERSPPSRALTSGTAWLKHHNPGVGDTQQEAAAYALPAMHEVRHGFYQMHQVVNICRFCKKSFCNSAGDMQLPSQSL